MTSGGTPPASSSPDSPAPLSRRERREAERRGDAGEPLEPERPGIGPEASAVNRPETGVNVVDPVVAELVIGLSRPAGPAAPVAAQRPRTASGPPGAQNHPAGRTQKSNRARRPPSSSAGSDPGWIPLSVLVGLPVLVAVALLLLTFTLLRRVPDSPLTSLILLAVVVPALALLVLSARRILTGAEPMLVGAPMSAQQEPRVWSAIDSVAADLGVRAPENLVVDGSQVVAVARSSGSRNMVIGLPLLLELEPPHFAAVLGRELALSTNGGLPAATRVHRLGERVDIALQTRPGGAVHELLIRYAGWFRKLAGPSVRRVEERADQQAVEIFGARQWTEAQQRLLIVQLAWQTLVEDYLPLSETAAMRPLLAEGLQEILTHRREQLAREAFGTSRSAGPPNPAVTGSADTGMLDDPGTLSRIEAAILLDEDPHGSWPEIANAAGGEELARQAQRYVSQLVTDPAEATLAGVLRVLDRPDRPVPAGGLASPLTTLVQDSLLQSGLAGFELNWTGPSQIRRRDPRGLWVEWDGDLAITAAAHSPAGVDQLRSWLFAAGADFERRYPLQVRSRRAAAPEPPTLPGTRANPANPATPSTVPPAPAHRVIDLREPDPRSVDLREPVAELGTADSRTDVTGASDVELLGPYPLDTVDLLVHRTGLLLLPVPVLSLQDRTRALVGRAPDVQGRLAELAETTGDRPEQTKGAWWIDLREITSASLRERRNGFELQLHKADGSATTLRQQQGSQLRGDPVGALRRLLPGH